MFGISRMMLAMTRLQDEFSYTYSRFLKSLSPVSYWRLNDKSPSTTAIDDTGNGHDGVYTNSPLLEQEGLLINNINTCVDFSGNKWSISSTPAPLTGDFTITFIFNTPSVSGHNPILYDSSTSGGIRLYNSSFIFDNFGDDWIGLVGSTPIQIDTVYHIVIKRVSGYNYIFINGDKWGSANSVTQYNQDFDVDCIGTIYPNWGLSFDGVIDEVATFNTALADEDCIELYNISVKANIPKYYSALDSLDPIAYWRLGETSGTDVIDVTGNFNGSYFNDPILGESPLFVIPDSSDTSVTFDGINQGIHAPTTVAPEFDLMTFSFSTIIYMDTFPLVNTNVVIFMNTGLGYNRGIYLRSDGVVIFTAYATSGISKAISTSIIDTKKPIHITGTASGLNGVKIYINGVLEHTETSYNGIDPGYSDVFTNIGSTAGGGNSLLDYFTGTIDDTAIYDYELSSDQVLALYESGKLIDKFSGTDGDSYNTDNWIDHTNPAGGTITLNTKEINNNQLLIELQTSNGAWKYTDIGVESNYSLAGDFDIEVQYDPATFNLSNGNCFGMFYVSSPSGTTTDTIFIYRDNTDYGFRIAGLAGSHSLTGQDDTHLRIVRIGSTGYIYTLKSGIWTEINSYTISTTDVIIRLLLRATNESGVKQTFYFDNFIINSGTKV